jgi:glycosyltransferase involved in cell wall biosynthesis
MRIAFLVRSLGLGGAERQLVALARGLHQRGHRVLVLSFYSGGPLTTDLVNAGVPVLALGKRHRWDLFGPFHRLFRALRRERPDLLHGYLVDANILVTLFARAVPDARIAWGVRASGLDMTRYPRAVSLLFRISTWLAGRADLIIANSESGAEAHIAEGYPERTLMVIPNGIDTVAFRPDAELRRRTRHQWGIRAGERLIGLVGRLDPMKGHDIFLHAAARLAAERPEVKFVCVGDGPDALRTRLEGTGRELGLAGRLSWLPGASDITPLYCAMDLLTSASLFGEGFPNVVGEAMACGVPCVVTDVGDSARVVGETGIVVPHGDPVALASGWRGALDWLDDPARPDPRKRIEREFGLDRMVDRTERALGALLAPRARVGA